MKPSWWASMPSEYQMGFIFALLAIACWACSTMSATLAGNLGALFSFLGVLAGGFLVHGGYARRTGNCKDLIGDIQDAHIDAEDKG